MTYCRCLMLLTCFAGFPCARASDQPSPLQVVRQGNRLRLQAPQMHFLEGKPLESLRNGSSVTYLFSVTVTPLQAVTPLFRRQERFTVSFDLWEERFAVVRNGTPSASISHLTAATAETWCVDNIPVPLPALPPEKSFVVTLDCRISDDANGAGGDGRPGLTLAGLIDVFSRKRGDTLPHWQSLSAPLRLADFTDGKQTHTPGSSRHRQ